MKRSEVEKIIKDALDANTEDNHDELASIISYELKEAGLPIEEDTLGAHKIIPNEAFDALAEDLLSDGVCPCGATTSVNCSVTGCPLYLRESDLRAKVFQTWRQG